MSHSPYFDKGAAHGAKDAEALSKCPPGRAAGKDPSKSWSVMYNRGYDSTFKPVPCRHEGNCKKARKRERARERGQATTRRAPLAFKRGSLAFTPGKMAFKPGSLAYNPNRGALAARMKARAERMQEGQEP